MNMKLLVFAWIVGILFSWLIMAAVGAAIVSNTGGGDSQAVFMEGLMHPTVILLALGIGTVAAPCCYCYGKDS